MKPPPGDEQRHDAERDGEAGGRESRRACHEVIATRNDDPDNPALGLRQGAKRGEEFLAVEMKVPRAAGRLFSSTARSFGSASARRFRRQIGGRNAQVAIEILQLIGRARRASPRRPVASQIENAMRIGLTNRRQLELHCAIQLLREQSGRAARRRIRPPASVTTCCTPLTSTPALRLGQFGIELRPMQIAPQKLPGKSLRAGRDKGCMQCRIGNRRA